MELPTRRRLLTAIATVPSLTVPTIAGEGNHDAHVAIEAFHRADERHRAAIEKVRMLTAALMAAELETAEANRVYDIAAVEAARALRVLLQRPV